MYGGVDQHLHGGAGSRGPLVAAGQPDLQQPEGLAAAEYRIINHVNRAIDNAPRGSTISMAMYIFNQSSTARKLYAAHRRGVNVQMIIDDGERSSQAALSAGSARHQQAGARSFVMSCKRSCMSNVAGSVLHSKFYAFSRVGSSR